MAKFSNSLHLWEQAGLGDRPLDITIETRLVAYIEKVWEKPDQGIWELRGPPRHFTHSKVMAWVGIDRFLRLRDIAAPRRHELEALRARMHRSICQRGFNTARNSFVQAFDGEPVLDASLLMLPLVNSCRRTIRASGHDRRDRAQLVEDGLARRWSRARRP